MPTSRAEARPDVTSPEPSPDSCPAATAAAGHRESRLVEAASEPRPNDLVPLAGDERHDPDTEGVDDLPHRPRDRTADERVDAEVGEAGRFPTHRPGGERLFRAREDPAGFGLDDEKLEGGVEDGGDPAAPAGEGRFRSAGGSVLVHVIEGANAAPVPAESSCEEVSNFRSMRYAFQTGSAGTPRSSAVATLLGGYGSGCATPLCPESTDRPAEGARCRACGSAGRASSCGRRAPSLPRAD